MRQALIVAVTAVALAASVGVSSRPAQAADRAAEPAPMLLAQNTGPNLFSLLQDIQRLREQVRRMRGDIESLRYQIKRNQESRQRMYQSLDERLTALEQGGAGTGVSASKEEIKKSYMAAFGQLRNGKYDAAISGFESFVKKYPDSSYGDNAWYWLGQARYVQGDLSGAMKALQTMTSRFPKSSKLPSALFRMGVIEQTEGKTDKARAAFERIVTQYPDSDSAGMARQHLKDLGQ